MRPALTAAIATGVGVVGAIFDASFSSMSIRHMQRSSERGWTANGAIPAVNSVALVIGVLGAAAAIGLGTFIVVGGRHAELLSFLMVSLGVLLSAALRWPQVGLFAALIAYFVAVSALPIEEIGIDVRLASLPFIGLLCLQATSRPLAALRARRTTKLLAAMAAVAGLSTLWSTRPSATVMATVGLIGMAALLWASGRLFDGRQLRAYLLASLTIIVCFSAVTAFLPIGHVGLRVSGIAGNPNAMGLVVLLFLPMAALSRRHRPILPIALVLLITSASRAAGLAVVAETLVLVVSIRRTGLRRFLFVLLVAVLGVGSWLLITSSGTEPNAGTEAPSIIRFEDSRQAYWRDALSAVSIAGTGWDAYNGDTASSYLKVVVEAGLAGAILLVLTVRHVARQARAGPTAVAAIGVGGLVNAAFESWLFSGGSFFAVMFWLAVASAKDPTGKPIERRSSRSSLSRAGLRHG